MCFADVNLGADLDITALNEEDSIKVLFSENAGIVFQADASVETILSENNIEFFNIGTANNSGTVSIKNNEDTFSFDVTEMRDVWYKTSFLLDQKQTANNLAKDRFDNYKNQPLNIHFQSILQENLPVNCK